MLCRGVIAACVLAPLLSSCSAKDERTYVLVSNEDSNDVTVVDAKTDAVVREIPVGKRPRGMRVAKDGKTLYVALSGSPKRGPNAPDVADDDRDDAADGIAVVDLDAGRVVRVLPSGRDPEAFDVTPDGKTLVVSNEESAEVSLVDVASAKVRTTVKVGAEPEGVTITPDGTRAFVTSESDGEVDVVDIAAAQVVARIKTSARPRAVAFSADGSQAYVTAEVGGALHVVDAKNVTELAKVATGGDGVRPMGVAVAKDGIHAYVANGRAGSVAVVDVGQRKVVQTIEKVGRRPWGIALTPDETKLYVAAGPDVAVIDTKTGTVVKQISAGKGPWGVAIARRER